MKRLFIASCIAACALPLAACYENGGVALGYGAPGPYYYDGYYDNYYGPIYDGYWGNDGYFYYRNNDYDRHYHRGDGGHFYRGQPNGGNFHAFHGQMSPAQGVRMPHFNPGGHGRDHH